MRQYGTKPLQSIQKTRFPPAHNDCKKQQIDIPCKKQDFNGCEYFFFYGHSGWIRRIRVWFKIMLQLPYIII